MRAPTIAATGHSPLRGTARAHGKAILLGEHAVVHGAPAIALPIPALHVEAEAHAGNEATIDSSLYRGPVRDAPARLLPTVTAAHAALARHGLESMLIALQIRSDIPIERGLGSSAAVAAATARAVLSMLEKPADESEIHEIIQEAERQAHGTPSGLDARSVVAEAPLWFQAGRAQPLRVASPFAFVLADTGIASGTREAVTSVHQQLEQQPERVGSIMRLLGELATSAREDLASGDRDALGARMDEAHDLLHLLHVSCPELDTLVAAAHQAGARGAKLTGGGRGGCIIALAEDTASAVLLATRLREAGARATWTATVEVT